RVGEVVGTDGEANGPQFGLGDTKPVADGIEVKRDVQFVDLAMVQKEYARRAHQHGGVIEARSRALDEARGHVNTRRFRGFGEEVKVWPGNRLREFAGHTLT